jgi:hypothetical protein
MLWRRRGRQTTPEVITQDIALDQCTPGIFRAAIIERGFIVLRRAIRREKVLHFKTAYVAPAVAYFSSLDAEEISAMDKNEVGQWWPGNEIDFIAQQCRNGFVNEPMLAQYSKGIASYFDLISDPRLHALLAAAFPGKIFVASPVTNCRTIDPSWSGVPLHCDLLYHRDSLFSLNFWTPLDPAGPKFSCPTLETVALSLIEVARFTKFAANPISFDQTRFDRALLQETYGEERIYVHDVDAGDILVFSSWTLHRSYSVPTMSHARLSAEIRLTGPDIIAEDILGR